MPLAAKRILLIDDDAAVLKYVSAHLSSRYEVTCAQDPHAGLALAMRLLPDAIVCDIDMPAMGGGEIAAALAAGPDTRGIPIIFLTGLVSPDEVRDLKGWVGGKPGVAKRGKLTELLWRIEQATGTAASA